MDKCEECGQTLDEDGQCNEMFCPVFINREGPPK